MTELESLIEDNKHRFQVDKKVLAQRIANRLVSYDNVIPAVNLEDSLCKRVRKHYQDLQSLLIDATDKLNGNYTLDTTNSRTTANGFTVTYVKNETLQKSDLTKLKKEEKNLYLGELEKKKEIWVQELTLKQAEEAKVQAALSAKEKTEALQRQLSELLTTK